MNYTGTVTHHLSILLNRQSISIQSYKLNKNQIAF